MPLRIDPPPMRRFEWKYRVPPEMAANLTAAMCSYTEPDCHGVEGRYHVRSLYYDTSDLRFYHEKKDGVKVRRKLRVRNYGDELCFLEIKRKINNKVLKERVSLPSSDVAGALNGQDLASMMSGRPVGDLRTLERFRGNLISLGLIPSVLIAYRRHALVGRQDPHLRITVDSELRCRANPGPEALFECGDLRSFEEHSVLELKFDDRPPRWLLNLATEFRLKREPFSKYCEGIDASGGPLEIAVGAERSAAQRR